jgi:hypothetical protein
MYLLHLAGRAKKRDNRENGNTEKKARAPPIKRQPNRSTNEQRKSVTDTFTWGTWLEAADPGTSRLRGELALSQRLVQRSGRHETPGRTRRRLGAG